MLGRTPLAVAGQQGGKVFCRQGGSRKRTLRLGAAELRTGSTWLLGGKDEAAPREAGGGRGKHTRRAASTGVRVLVCKCTE